MFFTGFEKVAGRRPRVGGIYLHLIQKAKKNGTDLPSFVPEDHDKVVNYLSYAKSFDTKDIPKDVRSSFNRLVAGSKLKKVAFLTGAKPPRYNSGIGMSAKLFRTGKSPIKSSRPATYQSRTQNTTSQLGGV